MNKKRFFCFSALMISALIAAVPQTQLCAFCSGPRLRGAEAGRFPLLLLLLLHEGGRGFK